MVDIEDIETHLQVTDSKIGQQIDEYILVRRLEDKIPFSKLTEEVNEKFDTRYTRAGLDSRYRRALAKKMDNYKVGLSEEEKVVVSRKLDNVIGLSLNDIQDRSLFRVGYLDIETTGFSADFGYILCAVIKDEYSGKYDVIRIDEVEGYNDPAVVGKKDFWKHIDQSILEKFIKMYEKYDVIVHFNGKWFDIAFLNTRMIKHGLGVLPEVKQIDVYQLIRKQVRLNSKKLDAIKEFLEVDNDVEGHEWEYWQMAGARVKEGIDEVVKHCKRDVDRLQIVTHRVRPLIKHIFKF